MSIGAIFTAVIVTSVIRADLFEKDNDESGFSNTTQEIPDGGNSMHGAIGEMLESFNNSLEGFQSLDEMITSSNEDVTTTGWDQEKNLSDEETTSISINTTTTFETPTTTLTVPTFMPKCRVEEIGTNVCLISCIGVQGDSELETELKRAIDQDIDGFNCLPNDVRLLIDNCTFGDGWGLESNWLEDLKPAVTITGLTIIRSNFFELPNNTFVNGPFTAIKELKIQEMNELLLRVGCFNGLTSLNKLVLADFKNLFLRNNTCCAFSISQLSATLTNLELTSIKNTFPISMLIGQTQFEKLTDITFSQNNFTNTTSQSFDFLFIGASSVVKKIFMDTSEITDLNSNMFTNCTSLNTISLMNNRITSIPPNIFQGLVNIELIRLQNNQLTTLPGDFLLEFMGTTGKAITLNLQNNSWDCSLEILHLKNLILDPRIIIQQNQTVCSSPPLLAGKRIADFWCSMNSFEEWCKVTCVDTNDEILNYQMENVNVTSCGSIKLELTNHYFEDKTLPQNWLSHLPCKISTLEIYSTRLVSFGTYAFNSSTFHDLIELTYDGNETFVEQELEIIRESFFGLNMLEKLEISRISQLSLRTSDRVFQEIASTVKEIAITNVVDRFFISRLIGSSEYEKLEKLKLNGNSFESSSFTEGTFNGTHKCLQKLYMVNSKIRTIDKAALNSFEVLIELHLQDNQIVFLPDDLFVNIRSLQPNFMVYLDNNPLNCSEACHLLPFANENVICASPENFFNDSLSVIGSICKTSSTIDTEPTSEESEEPLTESTTESTTTTVKVPTTTEESTTTSLTTIITTTTTLSEIPTTTTTQPLTTSTTSTTETPFPPTEPEKDTTTLEITETTQPNTSTSNLPPSTPGNPGLLEVPCIDGSLNPTYIRFINNATITDQRDSITVYRPPVVFSIESSAPNEVKITFERLEEGMVMLYYPISFNPFDTYVDDPNDVQCLAADEEILKIKDLSPNTVYTFCSLFQVPIFTPFQCMSHANNKGMPWLYEEQKVIIVTSLTLILLLALITGIIMTYFLIRRMPTLIRGSKRVVIVNNRAKEVMILPRSNNTSRSNSFRKDSVVTPIEPEPPTYLTPLPRQSIDHRPPLVRSNSETSVKSYVSVSRLPPRFSQVYQRGDFEGNHMARHRSYSRQLPLAPYDQSPELPPPLPRRSVVSASSVHNSIASTAEIGKLSRTGNHHSSTFRHRPSRCEVKEENLYNVII